MFDVFGVLIHGSADFFAVFVVLNDSIVQKFVFGGLLARTGDGETAFFIVDDVLEKTC